MRGDFSAIPDTKGGPVLAVLHQQGRLLSDYDLNLQNLVLRRRIDKLERWLVELVKDNEWKKSGVKINVDKAEVAADAITLPAYVAIPDATVVGFEANLKLTKDQLKQLFGAEIAAGNDHYLYLIAREEQRIKPMTPRRKGSFALQAIQRNLLKVSTSKLKTESTEPPTLTSSSQLKASGVHRYAIHDIIREGDNPKTLWLKYASRNLSELYEGKISGTTVTLSNKSNVAMSGYVEFVVPEATPTGQGALQDLIDDSVQNLRYQPLYKIVKQEGTKLELQLKEGQSPNPAEIPKPTDGKCWFYVWDWAAGAELKASEGANFKAEFTPPGAKLNVQIHKDTIAEAGWVATLEPDTLNVSTQFAQTIHFHQLANFKLNNEKLEPSTAMVPLRHRTIAAISARNPSVAESRIDASADSEAPPQAARGPSSPIVAVVQENVTTIEANAASASEKTAPIAIRDIPVRLLDLTYRTPELRRWASSVDLSEVASLSPESLMERVRRCVAMPADRQPQLAADVMSFADQIRVIAGQLRVNDQAVQTA